MIDVPQALIDISAKKVKSKTAFEDKADALVQVARTRKVIKLELEQKVVKARDEYRRGADILKVTDAPWAELEERLRDDLNRFIQEEDCPPENSIRTHEIPGTSIGEREVIVVHDLEQLTSAVAQGKAPADFLVADMPAIRAHFKKLGHFAGDVPGVEKQTETKITLRSNNWKEKNETD